MRADREPVRLVAQALQEIQHRVARLEREGRPPRQEEALAPGIAVGTLGDRRDRDVADAEFGERGLRLGELPLPAIDQHQIRPHTALALGIFLQRAEKAAAEHLAHHRVIIAAGGDRFRIVRSCVTRMTTKFVIPGRGGAESPESRNTGLWNMDSGFAAARRPGMTNSCAKPPFAGFGKGIFQKR